MTEPYKPGNKRLPDFKELEDRVIAERRTSGPMLVIKTNLDPEDATEDNPYYQNKELSDKEKFEDYFSDENGSG
ncbi:hypothetical protein A8F94_23800 [Bacillus sp. FJAT-27225]|uniref:hypothetical protein n=1 Tax=Bacillus sp. FJAT-27225 TaxID=1743144 RepID=UPI00080C358E|nr:hypothetical protein [Bacillus sp. FJAT-27225]OCA89272.1 hypothetical protein A8F94_23800 [Bacillus sp. FJAT-27225]